MELNDQENRWALRGSEKRSFFGTGVAMLKNRAFLHFECYRTFCAD